jgi:pyrimidine-nucleoside phosphorylase
MHIPRLIEKKRDAQKLSGEELQYLVSGLTDGTVPEYQWSALAMAIYFRGMDAEETAHLTRAMRDSGSILQYPKGHPRVVDKHSTGGIGDKVSLVLAPLLACCDVWCPMVSGRGLGITGGTLDKLESIPGFRVSLTENEMLAQLSSVGTFIAGQTDSLCPADRKLYALRDVTATVPSIPLITASILSKKLAENLDALILDVKYGSGAFMKTQREAQMLANSMEAVGRLEGVAITTQLNPMDQPLGRTVGNVLEVQEAMDTLQGHGPEDLEELVLRLATRIVPPTDEQLRTLLHNGQAWRKFEQMVNAQGGNLERFDALRPAPFQGVLTSPISGTVRSADAQKLGEIVVNLGGGRSRAQDSIDHDVGLSNLAKIGETVSKGQPLVQIHARTEAKLAAALITAGQAFSVE